MDDSELKWKLTACVDDMHHEMAVLSKELIKATHMISASRRARKVTINLTKLFKNFRVLTCEAGLK